MPPAHIPNFIGELGLTLADIAEFKGEVVSDRYSIKFKFRDTTGAVTGIETMRGPRRFLFTQGGKRALFHGPTSRRQHRVLIADGPLAAVCAAAVEGHRADTLYAAPGGTLSAMAGDALLGLINGGIRVAALGFSSTLTGRRLADDVEALVSGAFVDHVEVEEATPPHGRWPLALWAIRHSLRAA